jgi:protein transport protein SEC24
MSGHGHSQSQQFFSPAQRDAAPQFFTPGGQQNAPAQQQGAMAQNNDHVMYGQPPQPQSAGGFADPMSGMTNQFGQMGMGGQKPMQMVTTTNLINLPLNPAELMQLSPPEIRLPPNVRHLTKSSVCVR